MAACAGIGQAVFDDWVEWVLKGHHGEKDENIQAFKWRGLGKYGGHINCIRLLESRTLLGQAICQTTYGLVQLVLPWVTQSLIPRLI